MQSSTDRKVFADIQFYQGLSFSFMKFSSLPWILLSVVSSLASGSGHKRKASQELTPNKPKSSRIFGHTVSPPETIQIEVKDNEDYFNPKPKTEDSVPEVKNDKEQTIANPAPFVHILSSGNWNLVQSTPRVSIDSKLSYEEFMKAASSITFFDFI